MRRFRVTSSSGDISHPRARFEGPAAIRHGVRVEFGHLTVTDRELLFQGDERTSLALDGVAWVEAGQRSRQLTLEVTTRQAAIHRFFVTDVRWVQAVRTACADLDRPPVLDPIRIAAG